MPTKFLQLDEEKKHRIINAALKVFSQSDYKNASTDDIVKEAGISKGSLFYYFKNKKVLYEFIFEYVLNYLTNEIMNFVDLTEPDFLTRLRQVLVYKATIMNNYPDMFNFVLKTYQEDVDAIGVDFLSKSKAMASKSYDIFLKNIDMTKFRDDIDVNLAINTIMWSSDGYSNKNLALIKAKSFDSSQIDKLLEEYSRYLDLYRKCFYKGGN